jgi:hypothetical protein
MDQRERLVNANQKMANSTAKLCEALQVANDAEQTGIHIMEDLDRQKEQIKGISKALEKVDQNLDISGSYLKHMSYSVWDPRYWMSRK